MPTVCFDPVTGAAGDMILAALFDLGAQPDAVDAAVRSTGLEGFELSFSRSRDRGGLLTGTCEVRVHEAHGHHHHGHGHRGLTEILGLIRDGDIPPRAAERASAVFRRLADAEAAVHGIPPEEVHFHEVGAVDSIVDILGACIALEQLEVDHVRCSGFKVGRGTVRCAHGVLPVPAPATAKLLEGFEITPLDIESELTTPTGAAILTTLSEGTWHGLRFRLLRCGCGRGRREFEQAPNIIRAFLVEDDAVSERIEILETDIDDESPEATAALPGILRQAGALDATLTPLLMKKGRSGVRLTVVARAGTAQQLADLVFRHSGTLGVRLLHASRFILPRERAVADTPWGQILAKRVERPHGVEIIPEFEAARELAESAGVPIRDVMNSARRWTQPQEPDRP